MKLRGAGFDSVPIPHQDPIVLGRPGDNNLDTEQLSHLLDDDYFPLAIIRSHHTKYPTPLAQPGKRSESGARFTISFVTSRPSSDGLPGLSVPFAR